jgi:hypothetical protein
MFLEGAGRAFADAFGMSVIAVRLGWCPRTKEQVEEITAADWAQDVYLSPNDAGRFFACAVEAATPISFAVCGAASAPHAVAACLRKMRRCMVFSFPVSCNCNNLVLRKKRNRQRVFPDLAVVRFNGGDDGKDD